jgi:hypothetical protein
MPSRRTTTVIGRPSESPIRLGTSPTEVTCSPSMVRIRSPGWSPIFAAGKSLLTFLTIGAFDSISKPSR